MEKDFLKWHKRKEKLHIEGARVFFHEREVWWCSLGYNVGFEQDGKGYNFARPIIIFKKFNNEVFWSIPLTRKRKSGKFYVPVDLGDSEERSAIISQLRLVDAKRLLDKLTVLKVEDYAKIQKAVINLCQM
ncbi:MAG TPA: type II toxin-antitoxin system PemK/MazF family toxin [Candidatus Paceibacterota bacterium]